MEERSVLEAILRRSFEAAADRADPRQRLFVAVSVVVRHRHSLAARTDRALENACDQMTGRATDRRVCRVPTVVDRGRGGSRECIGEHRVMGARAAGVGRDDLGRRSGVVTIVALIVLAVAAFVARPLAGGPKAGRIANRPTEAECRAAVSSEPRRPTAVSVGWVWSSTTYGWACRYRYADGSTGTIMETGSTSR